MEQKLNSNSSAGAAVDSSTQPIVNSSADIAVNPMLSAVHSCSNCKFFYYSAPQIGQPYPEFTCTKGVWDGICSKEEMDSLSEPNDCKDFEHCT